jgi:hypothetical protein
MAVALDRGVDLRRANRNRPIPSQTGGAAPRPRAEGSGAFANPLPSMLELSAATRAVAAEPTLRQAIATLQREACRLTRAHDATVVTFDWAQGTLGTLDGSVMSEEVRGLMMRVASSGQRAWIGHALIEPVGSAPARAVLALRRSPRDVFAAHDVALVTAFVGGVAATLHRLLGGGPRSPRRDPR